MGKSLLFSRIIPSLTALNKPSKMIFALQQAFKNHFSVSFFLKALYAAI